MAVIPFLAMVRKDLQLFFTDQDRSAISKQVLAGAEIDKNLKVTTPTENEARDLVTRGTLAVAVVIPKGFGEAAGKAFFGDGERPALTLLHDPSRGMELAMVRGILTQHVMEAVSTETFGGDQRRGITMPYTVNEQAMTAGSNIAYNGYAHSFAGMAIQFLLFAMANMGVEMLLERQRGLWKRLRSAPISRVTLLSSKAASGTVLSLLILLVSFGFAMLVFRAHRGQRRRFPRRLDRVRDDGRDLRSARRGDRQFAGHRAWRDDTRRAVDGDARRRLGAHLHLPGVAAAGDDRVAGAMGRRRSRRDDVARHRSERRRTTGAGADRLRRNVLDDRGFTVQMGRGLSRSDGECHGRHVGVG